ncbi:MAG: M61 family metallopeptidase, partial [Armatimonadetes bacterium]|nr:M61 family metallopeptidase [Armatimonadota bacterium]
YEVRAGDFSRHLIDVALHFSSRGAASVVLRMPAWRPGRYSVQNFAGRVQEFSADGHRVTRVDKDAWRVDAAGAERLTVNYRCYANILDAGASMLDRDELYVNPISVLMAVEGRLDEPALLRLDVPANWRAAVPLDAVEDRAWRARDYHELVDSPFVASPALVTRTFEEGGAIYHLDFQGSGNYDLDRITSDVTKIVGEQVRVMGGRPPVGEYRFLYHLLPEKFSHGVEHARGASMAIGPGDDFDQEAFYDRFLSLTSHEFFHAWNVKRFRPDPMVPYDYWKEACTPLFWVAEGITSYYGDLTLARCGLWSRKRYFQALAEEIDALRNSGGLPAVSLWDSSWDAWSAGYGSAPPTKSLSFYNKGELVGLLLDLEIRRRSEGARSLDDVMRRLDATFGDGQRGYSEADFEDACADAAGAPLRDFFDRCVRTPDPLPLEEALDELGLDLEVEHPADKIEARLGCHVDERGAVSKVVAGSPAMEAGIEAGATLLAINGRKLNGAALPQTVKRLVSGDSARLAWTFRGRHHDAALTVSEGLVSVYKIAPREHMTPAQRRALDDWLGGPQEG